MPKWRPESAWRFVHRALLLGALVPLLMFSWAIHESIPRANLRAQFDLGQPIVYWPLSNPPHTANPHDAQKHPIKLMSLDTGEITVTTRSVINSNEPVNSQGERVAIGSGKSLTQALADSKAGVPPLSKERRYIYFYNVASGTSRRVEFDLPGDDRRIVGGRYVVSRDSQRIYAVDLEDAVPQPFSLAVPFNGSTPQVNYIYGTDFLFEVHSSISPTKPMKLEIFKLGDHQIALVKTLEIGSLARFDKQLVTLSADGKRVDYRGLVDLELEQSLEISAEFLATHTFESVEGPFLAGMNHQTLQREYYDVFGGVKLDLPYTGMNHSYSSEDRYWCFNSDKGWAKGHTCVYDRQAQRICLTIAGSPLTRFLNEGRFAALYPAYGVCVDVYDLKTGESTRHAPYLWYVFVLPIVLMAWFAWGYAWLIYSAIEGGWLLADLGLLFAISSCLFVHAGARVHFWHFFSVAPTQAFASTIGIAAGLLVFACTWMILSDRRIAISLLPLTLIWSTMSLWVQASPQSISFWHANVQIVLQVSLAMLVVVLICSLTSWFGWRLGTLDSNSQTESLRKPTSLLDLFVVMACIAVAIAAVKPIFIPLPKLHLQLIIDRFWLPTMLVTAAVTTTTVFTLMQPSALIAKFGLAIAALAWCVQIVQEVLVFSGFESPVFGADQAAINLIVSATISAFACTIAYRQRTSNRLSRAGVTD